MVFLRAISNNQASSPGGVLPPRGLAGTYKAGTDMAKHTRRQAHIDPDAFRTDVAHALHAAIERARELEIAGQAIRDAVLEAAFDDPGDELRSRAARLQGGARYALTLLSEIETVAGRLDGIGIARLVIEHGLDEEK